MASRAAGSKPEAVQLRQFSVTSPFARRQVGDTALILHDAFVETPKGIEAIIAQVVLNGAIHSANWQPPGTELPVC